MTEASYSPNLVLQANNSDKPANERGSSLGSSRIRSLGKKTLDVILLEGAWQDPHNWHRLEPLLADAGLNPCAVDLPGYNANRDFDDYAKKASRVARRLGDLVIVASSRGCDTAARVAERLARQQKIKKVIFINGAFHNATMFGLPIKDIAPDKAIKRNTDEFSRGILPHPSKPGLTIFDPTLARQVFFNQCSPADQAEAISLLRPQRRASVEPALSRWPAEIPMEYILSTNDGAVTADWKRSRARVLGIEPIEIPTDHTPHLSNPNLLAEIIVESLRYI